MEKGPKVTYKKLEPIVYDDNAQVYNEGKLTSSY